MPVCKVKMERMSISVLVLSLLMNEVIHVFGNVTILQGPPFSRTTKMICMSEDDGSALVWSTNLEEYYYSPLIKGRESERSFSTICYSDSLDINCEMYLANSRCVASWDRYLWNFTDSITTPMGLAFDQRWEGFQEYRYFDNNYHPIVLYSENSEVTVMPFSVRAERDLHIVLCVSKNLLNDLCYWIIIGGWDNRKSIIRKCPNGLPANNNYPADGTICAREQTYAIGSTLSAITWQSFIVTWNSKSKNITIYAGDHILMTYMDEEIYENTRETFNTFIRCPEKMLVRYHDYFYLRTTQEGASLTSPKFNVPDNEICLQMMIGLCAECNVDIVLFEIKNNIAVQSVTVKGSSVAAEHNLPMWQSVKIHAKIPSNSVLQVQLNPKLDFKTSNPLWAIASVRQCSPVECLRRSTIYLHEDWKSSNWFLPNITCQKLFYDKHTVVNGVSNVKPDVELDANCSEGYVGPNCSIPCKELESNFYCKGVKVCYKNGCTCPPGFILEESCTTVCPFKTYNHKCRKSCGYCAYNKQCNKWTGQCDDGCDKSEKIYIPPMCEIGIEKLAIPTIVFINQTFVTVTIPTTWKDEYNEASLQYYYQLQTPSGIISNNHKVIFPNTTELVGKFKNLQPASFYSISCVLLVNKDETWSAWKNFKTTCDSIENFDIQAGETNLTLNGSFNEDSYACPRDNYKVIIVNLEINIEIMNIIIYSFPYKIQPLPPYTLLNVTITNTNKYQFFQKIRTLESVPSAVLNLKVTMLSNTQCILNWRTPENPNGEITNYTIVVKVKRYLGCPNNKEISEDDKSIIKSTNETSISISDLHPYTSYLVQIRAYNSRYGSKEIQKTFSTGENKIPTSKVSQLKLENMKLSWSDPEDCTTISGQLKVTRIIIIGVSDAVLNYSETRNTKQAHLDISSNFKLLSAEEYIAKVYIVRDYKTEVNDTVYEKLKFKTKPTSPPQVSELNVVEIDQRDQIRTKIQLRWNHPKPPLNGELQRYEILWCQNSQCYNIRKTLVVELNDSCNLWNGYFCKTVEILPYMTIYVAAYNINVTNPSLATVKYTINQSKPDPPSEYTFSMFNSSAVTLNWFHPWITVAHLERFHFFITVYSTNLRDGNPLHNTSQEYLVDNYMPRYNKLIKLLPASKYIVYIESVIATNETSERKQLNISMPSAMELNGELNFTTNESYSTIALYIPCILHDTKSSMMYIIVKGPFACEPHEKLPPHLQKLAGVKMYEVAWVAAMAPANEFACKVFTIGQNENANINGTNCPLKSGNWYNIIVLLTEENLQLYQSDMPIVITKNISALIGDVPPSNVAAWLVPIIILLIVTGVAFYFYRRKQQKPCKKIRLQDEIILSQNIENYEHEAQFEISNSKQDLSTPSDRQSLSRATTPDVSPIAIEDNDKEREMTLVKVKDFEDYVRNGIQSGLLDKQYETFPRGQTQPWDYGKLPQNKSKNRYGNLIAYDENRVILKKLPNDDHSDYINANYITGYKKQKHYIATQGPKPNTVIDFWRMIWQEKVLIICMLANVIENGKTKCEQYWPDIGKKKKYGEVIVLNAKHNVFADYCFRTLQVTCGEETRKVEHLHYTAWPDHGIPLYTHSVVTYLKKLLATPPGNGPVVIHCSAGVGRTGTIVLCDICLHRAAAEGVVDVFAETASIRRERANMVDNKQQYLLAHLALVECLLSIPTTLPCNETLPARIEDLKKQLTVQQQRLQNTAWQDEALRQTTSPQLLSERNRAKNRFPELISEKMNRIYLKRYPASDEDSDYLSAVYVDGVKLQNQYLATQLPMPSTINDFWRMIAEFKVELILMLQPPDPEDPTCCMIAPENGEFKPVPYLNITTKETMELEYYTSQKLLLVDNSEKPPREQSVTILCLMEWKSGRNQPPPPVMTMVTFWQAAERIARGDGPTVTLCHDGVTGCGLYLALSFLLERMGVERECDVCLAVRAVRRSRPDFVRSLEHLEYLYDVAVTYLKYFETYANFS